MYRLYLLIIFSLLLSLAVMAPTCGDDDDSDDDDSADDDSGDDDSTDDDVADDDDTGEVWTDSSSGMMWTVGDELQLGWDGAKNHCTNLNWGGYDDWRLPGVDALRTLIRGCGATETGGACGVTDDCLNSTTCRSSSCDGCEWLEGPGSDGAYWPSEISGPVDWYWTSSPVEETPGYVYLVAFYDGGVDIDAADGLYRTRCVRP